MINLYRNPQQKSGGASILVVTIILLVATTLLALYAANYTILQTKITANQYSSAQAFEAAEAGLDYTVAYLQSNRSTVTASPTSGYISYGIGPTTLGNSASYSVVVTNPTQNNYNLLQIRSTGTAADGTTTDVLYQQVQSTGVSVSYGVTSQGNLVLGGNANVTGSSGANLGGTVSQSGSSTISNYTANNSSLSGMDSDTLFQSVFGTTKALEKAAATVYTTQSSVPWNSLTGTVWIDTSINLSSNFTVGTTTNPVLMIINGNASFQGSVVFTGLMYVMGTTSTGGNFSLIGGLVSQGTVTMQGSSTSYDTGTLNNIPVAGGYARVAGSWRDF